VGGGKLELGGGRLEVGSGKLEVGRGKFEVMRGFLFSKTLIINHYPFSVVGCQLSVLKTSAFERNYLDSLKRGNLPAFSFLYSRCPASPETGIT